MATAEFTIDSLVFSDPSASNDPQQRNWDYKKTVNVSTLSNPSSIVKSCTASADNTITLPATTINWLYIETDQTIKVKLNGESDTNNDVSPSAAGTSDGLFFKRGAVTQLVINVPGSTAANVRIFMGT